MTRPNCQGIISLNVHAGGWICSIDELLARQFVASTNQMHELLTLYEEDRRHGRQASVSPLIQCATIGCSLLSSDTYVPALLDDVWTLNRREQQNHENMQIITTDGGFELFLDAEGRLLVAAGAEASLTSVILEQCQEARHAARDSEFDVVTLSLSIFGLHLRE